MTHSNWIVHQKNKKQIQQEYQQHMSDQKALVSQEDIAALREFTGEGNYEKREYTPEIKLNQSQDNGLAYGEFFVSEGKNDAGEYSWKSLGKEPQFIIVRVRMQLKGFKDEVAYWSNEFGDWKEEVTLFTKGKAVVDTGTTKELKAKYDFVRSTYQLYVLYKEGNELKPGKLGVKGASMTQFIAYLPSFPKGTSVAQYWTQMVVTSGKKGAVKYLVINPIKKEAVTPEEFKFVLGLSNQMKSLQEAAKAMGGEVVKESVDLDQIPF